MSEKVLLTLRKEHVTALDALIDKGAASSRSEFTDKIVGGFLADLKAKRKADTAIGNLIGFLLLLLGVTVIAEILKGD
jgi:hypothetical protein